MKLLQRLRSLGIRPEHQVWEVFLIRKINFVSLIAFINVTSAYLLFPAFGLDALQPVLLPSMGLALLVIVINSTWGYVPGSYFYFLIGLLLITYMTVRLGSDSYFLLFFFPITLTVIQLLGRKETVLHMSVILAIYFTGILFSAYCYLNDLYRIQMDTELLGKIRLFNIVVSALTALFFITQITIENNRQEQLIRDMLKEKDVMMAEIFHRVKNNMNIVTSLLNLKKNNSDSVEVSEALEDCRNRVFSMALVHDKIFNRNNIAGLNFGEYTRDLVETIGKSMGLDKEDKIHVEAMDIELPLSQAIPCGLILNELVTNSCKHARVPGRQLNVHILLTKENGQCNILYNDNGPGMKEGDTSKHGSLGVELIHTLCEQVDGKCSFLNKDGLQFNLSF